MLLSSEEDAMLESVADADAVSASDVVRRLVRAEYKERFGARPPSRQTRIRRALDKAAEDRALSPTVRTWLGRCLNARKQFDRHNVAGRAIDLEYEANVHLDDYRSKRDARSETALVKALEELHGFYH